MTTLPTCILGKETTQVEIKRFPLIAKLSNRSIFKMKKLGFKLLFLMASICTSNLCAAADVEDVSSKFQSYTARMQEQKLPLTLIVGCGHGTYYSNGDHTHPDSWCVNMAIDPSLKGLPNNTEERFREDIQYDELLDITMSDLSHYSRYKGMFDVILLERPLPITLNKPWTLWNAAYMLKEGGELIIDSTMGYTSELYEKNTWLGAACSSDNQDYPVNQCPEKLKNFGISATNPKVYEEMAGISNFLNFWGFKDIINVGDRYEARYHAYQPYTRIPGQPLETARKTCILSATKTPETESKMESWAKVINPLWTGVREKTIDAPIPPVRGERAVKRTTDASSLSSNANISKEIKKETELTPVTANKSEVESPYAYALQTGLKRREVFHAEHLKMLSENIERNRKVIDWIEAEFRWPHETDSRDFWALQAIKAAYERVSSYANIATHLRRSPSYAEGDDSACKNANIYMQEQINEWISGELRQKLASKGLDWKVSP